MLAMAIPHNGLWLSHTLNGVLYKLIILLNEPHFSLLYAN